MSKQKFCSYGQHFVPADQAKLRPKPPGSPPSWICMGCRDRRRLSRERLAELTLEEKEARRARNKQASVDAGERKRREDASDQ